MGYVTAASLRGIALEKLEIETEATLDLRGFLCVDPAVPPGYERIRYVARVKGRGALAELEAIHAAVARMSPNYVHLARPVTIEAELVVE